MSWPWEHEFENSSAQISFVVVERHSVEESNYEFEATTPVLAYTSNSSHLSGEETYEEDSEPRRFRQLRDVYNDTEEVELHDELMLMGVDEPVCYSQEIKGKMWEEAMKTEIEAIERNITWNLAELPVGHKAIGLRWVYKLKRNTNGEIIKYKAGLVSKGNVQKQGVHYEEVFAPVTRL